MSRGIQFLREGQEAGFFTLILCVLVANHLAQKRLWLLLMSELFRLSNHRFKSKVNCRAATACNGALIDIRIVQRGNKLFLLYHMPILRIVMPTSYELCVVIQ